MKRIHMLSKADMVKGQGVLSAHDEQVNLVKEYLKDYQVIEKGFSCCEIMHFHTINPEFLILLPFAKRKGTCVGYVHFLPETVENSLQLPNWLKRIFYKYMIFFYKKMDYLVTVNPYFIHELEKYGINKKKIKYIPNFVSGEKFYPVSQPEKLQLRRKHKIKAGQFVVLCAGQLQKRKGFFDFIKIAESMPDCLFLWAGSFAFGKLSDGYEEIKEKSRNLPANVLLLGLVEREEMNEIFNLSDVLFLPSFEELFPMTVLEAMNINLPVVLRKLDIYNEILSNYAVFGADKEEFKAILMQLKSDSAYYQEVKKRSKEGHDFYKEETIAGMWKSFYDRIYMRGGRRYAKRKE